jgi:hypothetical protein
MPSFESTGRYRLHQVVSALHLQVVSALHLQVVSALHLVVSALHLLDACVCRAFCHVIALLQILVALGDLFDFIVTLCGASADILVSMMSRHQGSVHPYACPGTIVRVLNRSPRTQSASEFWISAVWRA